MNLFYVFAKVIVSGQSFILGILKVSQLTVIIEHVSMAEQAALALNWWQRLIFFSLNGVRVIYPQCRVLNYLK
jgi:hypothetical protein